MRDDEIRAYLKAIDAGAELNDRQVIALLLDGCCVSKSGYDAADALHSRFGKLSEICDVSSKELARIEGVGLEGARLLKACRAAVYAMYRDNSTDDDPCVFKHAEAINYIRPNFIGRDSEFLYIFLLNERCRLIHAEMIGRGNYEQVPYNSRRIIKLVGRYDASKVVLAHNHKASLYPSDEDTVYTNRLCEVLDEIEVELVDHIIFCENNYLSMRDAGYIRDIRKPGARKFF